MPSHAAFPYLLYLVISEQNCRGRSLLSVAEEAISGGVDIIQLREKTLDDAAFLRQALLLKEITDRYRVPLIINDNLAVAKAVGAFGIHVGNNDIPPSEVRRQWPDGGHIGYSVEYLSQLATAEADAADALGISPVFSTPTKTDTVTEWGLDGLGQIRSLTNKPLIAIGNMHAQNAASVIRAGANSIAVVSAICAADSPHQAAYTLKNAILKAI
ncbi:thiamine phosphate synthase [Arsenicibacter rosenii]|uniref:Thiamine-phosphate synthase n=1 Tax=Arsenicibacter rosenii TaxID=1750698 RepID=A0A1S2VP92_9BACT|nr:thiamine phosphate synthase [Arsenicibacter rosenii]OIN59598.1 thiamine-phosphate diphosphorylase [Arsenicibacter rosenii]